MNTHEASRRIMLRNILAAFGVAAVLGCTQVQAQTCERLGQLKLPDTTITTAQSVGAGAFTLPAGAPNPPIGAGVNFKELPAFCRVAGVIKPTTDSEIKFEVWMPASGWTGKFQGIGIGGFAGYISYGELGAAVARGYATASTDTGHSTGDAGWALGHPEKIVDYGHRAIHEMTVKSKAIVTAFYGSGPKRSYFASCSNGGRQALMEAQRYPNDYDGIIAGAPANYFTQVLTGFAFNMQATLADPASYIPANKLKAIEAAALASCDSRDGVKDNVIDDPTKCNFDPTVLLCKGAETEACLTEKQVTALKKVYSGPRDSSGKLITEGFVPGAETGPGGWTWVTGTGPGTGPQFFFSTQAFQNMVHSDRSWDVKKFDLNKDGKVAAEKLGHILNATDPNLKPFSARGGKII
ncbi:MAG TPA: tannase/feruloyl esterase family alpha/beta hydrolase, partial [Blastocatellia bacterium]|nr:tannase/feruloyl esterase family alpha/beta hydrolase [Blastocatellia bacterium]